MLSQVTHNSIVLKDSNKSYTISRNHSLYANIIAKLGKPFKVADILKYIKDPVSYHEVPHAACKWSLTATGIKVADTTYSWANFPEVRALFNHLQETQQDYIPTVNFLYFTTLHPEGPGFLKKLWLFIAANGFLLDNYGHIVGYKRVTTSSRDLHTGKVHYKQEHAYKMPRELVIRDPEVTCTVGLHVGSLGYMSNAYPIQTGRQITCLVNPKDVVSVPTDYASGKLRVCRLYIPSELGSITGPHVTYTVGAKGESIAETNEVFCNLNITTRSGRYIYTYSDSTFPKRGPVPGLVKYIGEAPTDEEHKVALMHAARQYKVKVLSIEQRRNEVKTKASGIATSTEVVAPIASKVKVNSKQVSTRIEARKKAGKSTVATGDKSRDLHASVTKGMFPAITKAKVSNPTTATLKETGKQVGNGYKAELKPPVIPAKQTSHKSVRPSSIANTTPMTSVKAVAQEAIRKAYAGEAHVYDKVVHTTQDKKEPVKVVKPTPRVSASNVTLKVDLKSKKSVDKKRVRKPSRYDTLKTLLSSAPIFTRPVKRT